MMADMRLGAYFHDKIPDGAKERDYADTYAAFRRTSQERRFMLTSKGYMGWAPDNAQGSDILQTKVGDLICIIFGCSTPLVIRPNPDDGSFEVIGEAYVEGMMEGQALDLNLDAADFLLS